MDHDDILWVLGQPVPDIVCELEHLLDAGYVVIIYHDSLHPVVEVGHIIGPLTAQVVQLVSVLVLGVQESRYLLNWVPVQRPQAGAREARGDNSICDLKVFRQM